MDKKIFEIHPKKPISGILPNNKRISEVTRMPLSRLEFLRCMNFGTVYAVVGEDRVLVTETNYDKALALFDKHVEYTTVAMKIADIAKPNANRCIINADATSNIINEEIKEPIPEPVKVVEEPEEDNGVHEEKENDTVEEEFIRNQEEDAKVEEEPTEAKESGQQYTQAISVSAKKKNKNRHR